MNTDIRNRIPRGVPQELFQEIIQDLIIRFILCCPEEEHESFERLFFQIEEAHWFYLDFYREKHPKLPALSFKQFAEIIFNDCPLLQSYKHSVHQIRSTWVQYKTSVPVCGSIILNKTMDRALLVKSTGGAWSFPRGKINKDEPSSSCAIREVYEETSLNISHLVQENEFIELVINEQSVKLFIVVLDRHESELNELQPQTRGEISEIQWLHIDEDILQGEKKKRKFWSVLPFARQVKQWIKKRRFQNSSSCTRSSLRITSSQPGSLSIIQPPSSPSIPSTNSLQAPSSPSFVKKSPKSKPSKRSGKNGARRMVPETELDYRIPPPRVKKSQPITILKRGEILPASASSSTSSTSMVSSSYTPPPLESLSSYAYSPPVSSSPYASEFNTPTKPLSYSQSYSTMHMKQDSFLNFTFNAEDIVGDLTVVM